MKQQWFATARATFPAMEPDLPRPLATRRDVTDLQAGHRSPAPDQPGKQRAAPLENTSITNKWADNVNAGWSRRRIRRLNCRARPRRSSCPAGRCWDRRRRLCGMPARSSTGFRSDVPGDDIDGGRRRREVVRRLPHPETAGVGRNRARARAPRVSSEPMEAGIPPVSARCLTPGGLAGSGDLRGHLTGVVSTLSSLSTTNTASSFAGSVALALRLIAWLAPGASDQLSPAR